MSLSRCCRLFGLSRQSLYQSNARAQARAQELAQIRPLVQRMRMEMPRVGTRKLYYLLKQDLKERGIKIGRDALFDYLRSEQLLIKPKKMYVQTTNSKHWLRKHPNLLKGRVPKQPEEVFVSDITYVKTRQGTHYLSLVTDAFSRKIMGYELSDDMRAETVAKALKMAVDNRVTTNRLIHHSDRGLQYCAESYQKILKQNNITPSMTDGYDCYQNALAERLNGIIKHEFLVAQCNNRTELNKLIKQSINTYNQSRPHLSLEMKTPNFIHQKAPEEVFEGYI